MKFKFAYGLLALCCLCLGSNTLFAGKTQLEKEVRSIETDVTELNNIIASGNLQQEHLAAAIIKLNEKLDQLTLITQELKKDMKASQPGAVSKTIAKIETIKKVIRYAIYTTIIGYIVYFGYKHRTGIRNAWHVLDTLSAKDKKSTAV